MSFHFWSASGVILYLVRLPFVPNAFKGDLSWIGIKRWLDIMILLVKDELVSFSENMKIIAVSSRQTIGSPIGIEI